MTARLSFLLTALCLAALCLAAPAARAADAPAKPAAKASAEKPSPLLQVGDTVYVCGCGPECTCTPHISAKPAKCGCGQAMVKAKVTKVGKGEVTVQPEGKPEQVVKTPYTCGCGEGCTCNTASLKPGKCTCGKPMVKAK